MRWIAMAVGAVALLAPVAAPAPAGAAVAAGPKPISISASGANGAGTSQSPGLPCSTGGSGASWHYDYTAALPAGALAASLPSELRLHLGVNAEPVATTPVPAYDGAFFSDESSQAVLADARGAVRLALATTPGDCLAPPLAFDGTTVSGNGTWLVVGGTGAYRGAAGNGTFSLLNAGVAPGADNPFSVSFGGGSLDVLDPGFQVTTVGSYWGRLGLDYLSRVVTVVHRFTNPGPGDAFGVRLTDVRSTTSGVVALDQAPLVLGDLAAGESVELTVRYRLDPVGPCQLIILNCRLNARFTASVPDALDQPVSITRTAAATAPLLPPPL